MSPRREVVLSSSQSLRKNTFTTHNNTKQFTQNLVSTAIVIYLLRMLLLTCNLRFLTTINHLTLSKNENRTGDAAAERDLSWLLPFLKAAKMHCRGRSPKSRKR